MGVRVDDEPEIEEIDRPHTGVQEFAAGAVKAVDEPGPEEQVVQAEEYGKAGKEPAARGQQEKEGVQDRKVDQ